MKEIIIVISLLLYVNLISSSDRLDDGDDKKFSLIYLNQSLSQFWIEAFKSEQDHLLYLRTIVQSLFLCRQFRSVYYGKEVDALPNYLKAIQVLPPSTPVLSTVNFDHLVASCESNLTEHLNPNKSLTIPAELHPLLINLKNKNPLTYLDVMQSISRDFEDYEFNNNAPNNRVHHIQQALFLISIIPQFRSISLKIGGSSNLWSIVLLYGVLIVVIIAYVISLPLAMYYRVQWREVDKSYKVRPRRQHWGIHSPFTTTDKESDSPTSQSSLSSSYENRSINNRVKSV